jgi:hypothetical protein
MTFPVNLKFKYDFIFPKQQQVRHARTLSERQPERGLPSA